MLRFSRGRFLHSLQCCSESSCGANRTSRNSKNRFPHTAVNFTWLPAKYDQSTEITMKFLVIVKANKDSEAGVMPSTELLIEMGNYKQQLIDAGIMLAGMFARKCKGRACAL